MKHTISILKNKDGNAIVIAMMILVLLTIIGTTATRNTTVELQIVRNDIVHRDHLYRADSASMEGVQWLSSAPVDDLLDYSNIDELNQTAIDMTALDLNDGTNLWERSASDPIGTGLVICGYTIVDETGVVDLDETTQGSRWSPSVIKGDSNNELRVAGSVLRVGRKI
jgi:hypothetical protein